MRIYTGGYYDNPYETLEDITPHTYMGDFAAQTWVENISSVISRNAQLADAARGEQLRGNDPRKEAFAPAEDFVTVEEAKNYAAEMGAEELEFGKSITRRQLELLVEWKREEKKRKAVIATAPDTFGTTAAKLGTGLAVSVADPLNIAAGFIPVVGQARYAKMVAQAGSGIGRVGVRAGVGAAEGLAGAAMLEPIIYSSLQEQQAEYGLYDSYLNLVFGTILGAGMHSGLGAVGDALGKSDYAKRVAMLQAATGQMLDGNRVDLTHFDLDTIDFNPDIAATRKAHAAHARSLSAEQVSEIGSYRQDSEVNARLRRGEVDDKVKRLDNAIYQHSFPTDTMVYRVVDERSIGEADPAYKMGTTSEAKALEMAEAMLGDGGKPVVIRIMAKKGQKGLLLGGEDAEAVLPRGTKLKPLSEEIIDGQRTITTAYGQVESKIKPEVAPPRQEVETPKPESTGDFKADAVMQMMEDRGEDVTTLRKDIDDDLLRARQERDGIREAAICMLGGA